MRKMSHNTALLVAVLSLPILLPTACARRRSSPPRSSPGVTETALPLMKYTIQAGAFSKVENATRLTDLLCRQGLDATYLVESPGLYKVRFGNFPSKEAARAQAEALKSKGVIEEFYIVRPEDYAVHKKKEYGEDYLREAIAKTAQSYAGLPYHRGSASANTGFDSSGLAMAVYQINGLDMPRSLREQYRSGSLVDRGSLKKGDLIFFCDWAHLRVNHVGIYVGDDHFVHTPGREVRCDSLSQLPFRTRYRGARSYM